MQDTGFKPADLLKKLIAFDTSNPPGKELECAEYLAGILGEAGFETQIQLMPEDPGRANVIAAIGNPKGKKLIYNGHIDVVPASEGWTSDPFTAEIRDGRLYGRGACDMKGGVAAMSCAAAALAKEGFHFDGGQLILVFVCDEELHDLGVKHYIQSEQFVKADFAVISEPSSLCCCIAHRGVVRYRLSVLGRSCHAGVPQNGINAITNTGYAILALEELAKRVGARTHEVLPSPTLTMTMISGGTKDNIVPGQVDISIDRRMLPDEDWESCMEEIREELESVRARVAGFDYRLEPYVSVNAGYIPPDSELVKICNRVFEETFGRKTVNRDFTGCNDQNFFVRAGVPTLVFGPGNLDQAHTVDEYVDVGELEQCTEFFYHLAKDILS